MRGELSELIQGVTALRGRANEITTRMRRDTDLLADIQYELLDALNKITSALAAIPSSSSPTTASPTSPPPLRMLRIDEVARRMGLGRSSIWRMVKDGHFPKPRNLSPHAVGWLEQDVNDWLIHRPPFDEPATPKSRLRRTRPGQDTAEAECPGR